MAYVSAYLFAAVLLIMAAQFEEKDILKIMYYGLAIGFGLISYSYFNKYKNENK